MRKLSRGNYFVSLTIYFYKRKHFKKRVGELDQVKKQKTKNGSLPYGMGIGLFPPPHNVICEVRLSDLPFYHRYAEEGKCCDFFGLSIKTMRLTSLQKASSEKDR